MVNNIFSYDSKYSECTGKLFIPASVTAATPKILLIHGGGWQTGWDRSSARGVAEFLRLAGFAVFNIDYRLAPENRWPACGSDCFAAAEFLLRGAIPQLEILRGKPILVCGISAGGHLALMTGLRLRRADVLGIVSISGIASLAPDRAANPTRYTTAFEHGIPPENADPLTLSAPDSPPILLTHYYGDTVVPVASAIEFADRADRLGCPVRTYFYDHDRAGQWHAIWIPDSNPHRLYPDIEDACLRFLRECAHLPEPLAAETELLPLGRLKTFHSGEIAENHIGIGFETLDRDMFDPQRCYDKLAAIGAKHARVQTGWWKCEREKGRFDFSWLDLIVDNLIRRGVRPWFNVGFGNKLYMQNTYGEASVGFVPTAYGPECLAAWRKFCTELAAHFRGRVTEFEIWNESNLPEFWQPEEVSAEKYARLIDLSQAAIRSVLPDAKIGAAVSGSRDEFILAFAETGILPELDFFSLHPYQTQPELGWARTLAQLKRFFAAHGGARVEIRQGECGYASWCPEKYWQSRFERESEHAQAVWTLRRYLIDAELDVRISSFFQITDMMQKTYKMGQSTQDPFKTARQGLLNGLVYTPKPAYFALRNFAALFRGGVRTMPGFCEVRLDAALPRTERHSRLEDFAVHTVCLKRRDNAVFYAYYLPAEPQFHWPPVCNAVLELRADPGEILPRDPVLVNLLSGDVFRVQPTRRSKYSLTFSGMPLTDYPLILCDRAAVILQ